MHHFEILRNNTENFMIGIDPNDEENLINFWQDKNIPKINGVNSSAIFLKKEDAEKAIERLNEPNLSIIKVED